MGWFSMDGWASSLIGSAGATRRDIEQFNALPVIIREYFPRSHIQLANGLLRVLDPVAQSLGGQPLSGGKAIMGEHARVRQGRLQILQGSVEFRGGSPNLWISRGYHLAAAP
ncbi:hypothetical protein PG999_011500 [Apiospora kogelbergensis]|uniref:Uncharacterized protein n=1 Tax=Apiospora kogelbergensis TaxID=1337665 RepID=A0AAW0QHB4_9PEZI